MILGSAPLLPDPPPEMVRKVGGSLDIGHHHVVQLRQFAGLQPHEHVLDIGCGVGRTAIHLIRYLSGSGSYAGFDVDPDAINWCRREVMARYPNFRFECVDLWNGSYNTSGTVQPSEFRFPFDDERFDLVFLYSVFTHMLRDDIDHYLAEIRRVMKPGGRVLATFFILTGQTQRELSAAVERDSAAGEGRAARLLENESADFSFGSGTAEDIVAYKEAPLRRLYAKNELSIQDISWGTWSKWATGETEQQGPQDAVLAYSHAGTD
jgi:SAM-dependent methyltransferase